MRLPDALANTTVRAPSRAGGAATRESEGLASMHPLAPRVPAVSSAVIATRMPAGKR